MCMGSVCKDMGQSCCSSAGEISCSPKDAEVGSVKRIFVGVDAGTSTGSTWSNKYGSTHSSSSSRVPTAFDTRKLQSNIRSFSELSSTASLGIDCRREDLDAVSFKKVRLRTAGEVFSVRGKREGRRHNLVDRRKDFQKEGGKLGLLTRLTS